MDASIIHQCSKSIETSRDLLLKLKEEGLVFDAVLASDDSLAVGAVKYAHLAGISIPEDLSIIGYNNSILSRCTDPEITSIDSKVEALCTTTVNTLMGVFSGANVPNRTTIASALIKRKNHKLLIFNFKGGSITMKQFLDKDFLLSTEMAKTIYHDYAESMPILSYHCHINPQEILRRP